MRFCGRFMSNPCSCKESIGKHITFDTVIPVFAVPILTLIASLNLFCTVVTFSMTPLLVYYLYKNFLRFLVRTKFFLVWTVTSVLMLLLVFEFSVVPLLEILPEENFVFVVCVMGGLVCGYKTRQNADQYSQESIQTQIIELGEGSGKICNICRRQAPPKAFHCRLCQTCILGREYHSKWLDCCIGLSNLRWYLACLLFSAIAFIYGSNLTMTTVCHPFILVATILLPDDCSDVYHQLDMAICFISSIYSLLIGLIVFFYLLYHLWLLYLGKTTHESLYSNENGHNEGAFKKIIHLLCCKL